MLTADNGARFSVSAYVIFISDGGGFGGNIHEDLRDMSEKEVIFYGVWTGNLPMQNFTVNYDLTSLGESFVAGSIAARMLTEQDVTPVSGRDIVFLLDGSGSMGDAGFQRSLNFICSFAGSIAIGPQSNQIAIGVYTDHFESLFYLDAFTSADTLRASMASIVFSSASTANLAMALQGVLDYMFTIDHGKRYGTGANLIILSDGAPVYESQDDAQTLRDKGATIFTVDASSYSNTVSLQTLASSSKHHFAFYGTDTSDIITAILNIAGIGYILPITALTCDNGAIFHTKDDSPGGTSIIVAATVIPVIIISGVVVYILWKRLQKKPPDNCDTAPLSCYTWDLLLVADQKDAAMMLTESIMQTLRTSRPRHGIKRTDLYRLRICKESVRCKQVVFLICHENTKIQDCLQICESPLIIILNSMHIFEFNRDFRQVLSQRHNYNCCWTRIIKPFRIRTNAAVENSPSTVLFIEALSSCICDYSWIRKFFDNA
ncbi:uncharacterized protein LOC128232503 isoform X2 [Mya arenaria]|nr:uncharacterized protein LOC128232503 isoform X2 [Mya arenaria]XP_052802040.1 uncharacterized protein LOC128232503 isoform X2 [Mya arenaria]